MSQYMLLKLSQPVSEGLAYKYLGNIKIRIPRGWITVPDPRHVLGVKKRLGLDLMRRMTRRMCYWEEWLGGLGIRLNGKTIPNTERRY